MEYKECTKCKESKPAEGYGKGKTACKACTYLYQKEWSKTPKAIVSRHKEQLRRCYNMSVEEYDILWESQGKKCAICRTEEPGGKGKFHVDHCHTTEEVRGILCHNCNSMLGFSRDSQHILERAIMYLGDIR